MGGEIVEYSLNLEDNAIDSFNEALDKYKLGESGETRSYKFAILHLSHFVELLLKAYVSSVGEKLVFSKCFKKTKQWGKSNDESNIISAYNQLVNNKFDFDGLLGGDSRPFTITVDDALDILRCDEKTSQEDDEWKDYLNDITWMKDLRNSIEHYEFTLSPVAVRKTIGRLVRGSIELAESFSLFDFEKKVGRKNYDIFKVLSDEYDSSVREAIATANDKEREAFKDIKPDEYGCVDWKKYTCPECYNSTLIPDTESETGYKCQFCENTESDEIEVSCDCCGVPFPISEMEVWPMDDEGPSEYRCNHCSGRYQMDKDD